MKKLNIFLSAILVIGLLSQCQKSNLSKWEPFDESLELSKNQSHANPRMQYKLIQSKYLNKNTIWVSVLDDMKDFTKEDYMELKPYILDKSIEELQSHVRSNLFTYTQLTQWYIYRIIIHENDPEKTLHSIISLNPNAVEQARLCDQNKSDNDHPIFGIPVLLKDNINTQEMNTTAGAVALRHNRTEDAFIVKQIKAKGGIILGKTNLSEWAYFFCKGCPLGYSAIGGQTLNPYGRKEFETGGSSAGSGTTIAANYAPVAVGTETSGSILSPSSQNSLVGLKPTVGLLSRDGIVPISHTLDTPGPMTKSIQDNIILLDAMAGKDENDPITLKQESIPNYLEGYEFGRLADLRLAALNGLIEEVPNYAQAVNDLKNAGIEAIILNESDFPKLPNFLSILNIDMKYDIPRYLKENAGKDVLVKNLSDIIAYNQHDMRQRAPYKQEIFEDILMDSTSTQELDTIIENLEMIARNFFEEILDNENADAMMSVNNYHASYAAAAKYPCLTVPMGYKENGEPINLTFIARPYEEKKLIQIAYQYEQLTKHRKTPVGYR